MTVEKERWRLWVPGLGDYDVLTSDWLELAEAIGRDDAKDAVYINPLHHKEVAIATFELPRDRDKLRGVRIADRAFPRERL